MSERHYVDIIAFEDEKTIKRLGPFTSERKARKVCAGADINLDHDRFFTRIESSYLSDSAVAGAVKGLIKDVERSRND